VNAKATHLEAPAADAVTPLPLPLSWTLGLGAALVLLGALAMTLSVLATLVSVLFVACLLVLAGAAEAVSGFRDVEWGGLLLHVVNGVLSVIAGVLAMMHPGLGALFLTLFMAIFFMVVGLVRLVVAIAAGLPHRAWIALSGLIALALGLVVWSQLPEGAVSMIGTFVGIDLVVAGWAWLMRAAAFRRYERRPMPPVSCSHPTKVG